MVFNEREWVELEVFQAAEVIGQLSRRPDAIFSPQKEGEKLSSNLHIFTSQSRGSISCKRASFEAIREANDLKYGYSIEQIHRREQLEAAHLRALDLPSQIKLSPQIEMALLGT